LITMRVFAPEFSLDAPGMLPPPPEHELSDLPSPKAKPEPSEPEHPAILYKTAWTVLAKKLAQR